MIHSNVSDLDKSGAAGFKIKVKKSKTTTK